MDLTDSFNQLRKVLGQIVRNKTFAIGLVAISASLLGAFLYLHTDTAPRLRASLSQVQSDANIELGAFPIKMPTLRYGFAIDTLQVEDHKIRTGQFLADLLLAQQLEYTAVQQIVQNTKGVFNVNELRVGNPYTLLTREQETRPDYLVYEPNIYEYIIFHLKGDLKVERIKRPTSTEMLADAGEIQSSLWQAMTDAGMSYELADKMEDALQWSIDFHHLQKGDQFRLVYDQHFVEGTPASVGKVHAAHYKSGNKEYYAIYYDNGDHKGYYDQEGRPMKSAFLKAPLKYSRISSYYNLNRFHPILKYNRPHYGTDYAAPEGTPIMAVGDGVVTQASYTSGNGNFVRIKHDKTYETQYLHMQKFAQGVRAGTRVRQGQTIGYVGSTGLATGPHVCFRFWKNGEQVNHLKLNFPNPEPLPASELPRFYELRDQYLALLHQTNADATSTDSANP